MLSSRRTFKKVFVCSNPKCNNEFVRVPNEVSLNNYCSHRCASIVSNQLRTGTTYISSLRTRRLRIIKKTKVIIALKICEYCKKKYLGYGRKYCSPSCQHKGESLGKEFLLGKIKEFYEVHGRIPFKKEIRHYRAIRGSFGTWNNAITIAGFEPNPVMFAKKHTAKDGHICDSLAEKIIDDWLYRRKIKHELHTPYPGEYRLKTDFVVGKYWIEFFGLSRELKRYDELKKLKLRLIKKYDLKLIALYPEDLFPVGKLNEKLSTLV